MQLNAKHVTKEIFAVGPREVYNHFTADTVDQGRDIVENLDKLGIGLKPSALKSAIQAYGMDSAFVQNLITTASITVPVEFLREWLVGIVNIITNARKIDELVGKSTQGRWYDAEVVQKILELTGTAVPYTDYGNTIFNNWNVNYAIRNIVNFESGLRVGRKEEAQSGEIQVSSSTEKRLGCTISLEIQRNAVGFYGYNSGANLTYGFLNDPNLPAYQSAAFPWSGGATFLEIVSTLINAFTQLQTQSGDNISPEKVNTTLAVPTNSYNYLTSTTTDFGITVLNWLNTNYPKCRIVSAPELDLANGGQNVFYLYAEEVPADGSTDDSRTFIQVVPSSFQLLGVAQEIKYYEEGYLNATAGVLLKRPWAVCRYTGI